MRTGVPEPRRAHRSDFPPRPPRAGFGNAGDYRWVRATGLRRPGISTWWTPDPGAPLGSPRAAILLFPTPDGRRILRGPQHSPRVRPPRVQPLISAPPGCELRKDFHLTPSLPPPPSRSGSSLPPPSLASCLPLPLPTPPLRPVGRPPPQPSPSPSPAPVGASSPPGAWPEAAGDVQAAPSQPRPRRPVQG